MTKKDIIVVGFSIFFISLSIYFMLNMLDLGGAKKNSATNNNTSQQKETEITGNFENDDTLEAVKKLKDYGGSELSNIGRVNPFGPLN